MEKSWHMKAWQPSVFYLGTPNHRTKACNLNLKLASSKMFPSMCLLKLFSTFPIHCLVWIKNKRVVYCKYVCMCVTFTNKIKNFSYCQTEMYHLKVVSKMDTKLMGRPNGIISIKMAALALSGEQSSTMVSFVFSWYQHWEMPGLNCLNCQNVRSDFIWKDFHANPTRLWH